MIYKDIKEGVFLERPNRFIALVEIDGKIQKCHVKNTGRCKELLIPGVKVYVQEQNNPNRKTKYDLINVIKGERMVNIDSQVPNKLVYDWILEGNYFKDLLHIQREKTFGNSRFDLYLETKSRKIFIEVKGVTLEEDGLVRFPDAPTQRGVKHIKELSQSIKEGYEAFVFFVIQMENVKKFQPNDLTHYEFGQALREGKANGIKILAYDCKVGKDRIKLGKPVPVDLLEESQRKN